MGGLLGSSVSMCVRHVILLIVQTDRVLGGPWTVNAGWPAHP